MSEEATVTAVESVATSETRCCARKCGARAYVFAEFKTGALGFCGHHGTERWDAINRQALVVIDHRDQILPDPE